MKKIWIYIFLLSAIIVLPGIKLHGFKQYKEQNDVSAEMMQLFTSQPRGLLSYL